MGHWFETLSLIGRPMVVQWSKQQIHVVAFSPTSTIPPSKIHNQASIANATEGRFWKPWSGAFERLTPTPNGSSRAHQYTAWQLPLDTANGRCRGLNAWYGAELLSSDSNQPRLHPKALRSRTSPSRRQTRGRANGLNKKWPQQIMFAHVLDFPEASHSGKVGCHFGG